MLTLVVVLVVIACIILAFIVLIQNSKGGGLASNFAGSNQIMGVRKTTDFLEKATWGLAAFIMVLCFVCAFLVKNEFKANDPYAGTQTEQVEDTTEE
ncbi:MAG: preprotein translocase subunit SecG [Bacteroidales bacterium]|nr:preprotein translocase subunit SecG [Bacteroidales bacterium]